MLLITVFYIYHDCYAPGSETLYGMEIECSYPLYKYFNSIALNVPCSSCPALRPGSWQSAPGHPGSESRNFCRW